MEYGKGEVDFTVFLRVVLRLFRFFTLSIFNNFKTPLFAALLLIPLFYLALNPLFLAGSTAYLPADHWSLKALHDLAVSGLIQVPQEELKNFPYAEEPLSRTDAAFYVAQAGYEAQTNSQVMITQTELNNLDRLFTEFRSELKDMEDKVQAKKGEITQRSAEIDSDLKEFNDIESNLKGSYIALAQNVTYTGLGNRWDGAWYGRQEGSFPANMQIYSGTGSPLGNQFTLGYGAQNVGVGLDYRIDNVYTLNLGGGVDAAGNAIPTLGGSFPVPLPATLRAESALWGTRVEAGVDCRGYISPLTMYNNNASSEGRHVLPFEQFNNIPPDNRTEWNTVFTQLSPFGAPQQSLSGLKLTNGSLPYNSEMVFYVNRFRSYSSPSHNQPENNLFAMHFDVPDPATSSTYAFNAEDEASDPSENRNNGTAVFNCSARSLQWTTRMAKDVPYLGGMDVDMEYAISNLSSMENQGLWWSSSHITNLVNVPVVDNALRMEFSDTFKGVPLLNMVWMKGDYYRIGPEYAPPGSESWVGNMPGKQYSGVVQGGLFNFWDNSGSGTNYALRDNIPFWLMYEMGGGCPVVNWCNEPMEWSTNREGFDLLLAPKRIPASIMQVNYCSSHNLKWVSDFITAPVFLGTFPSQISNIGGPTFPLTMAPPYHYFTSVAWGENDFAIPINDPAMQDPTQWCGPYYTTLSGDFRTILSKFLPIPRVTYFWISGILQSTTKEFQFVPATDAGAWMTHGYVNSMIVYNLFDPLSICVGYGAETIRSAYNLYITQLNGPNSTYALDPLNYLVTTADVGLDLDLMRYTILTVRYQYITSNDATHPEEDISNGIVTTEIRSSYSF